MRSSGSGCSRWHWQWCCRQVRAGAPVAAGHASLALEAWPWPGACPVLAPQTDPWLLVRCRTAWRCAAQPVRPPDFGCPCVRRLCRSVPLIKRYSAHSLRYAYCVDKLVELVGLGYDMAEACREVAPFFRVRGRTGALCAIRLWRNSGTHHKKQRPWVNA
jgi:hypothetical protein